MKKLFAMFFMASLMGMALISCGDDEPNQTKAPDIKFEILESEAVVTAVGQGEVLLFIDGEATTNPTHLLRINQDYVSHFKATAQETGKAISETTSLDLTIPKSNKPISFQVENEYQDAAETHFMFDVDMDKELSSIYMYNIVFRIGEATSPAMTLRVDAPVTVNPRTRAFTYTGTGIVAYMMRGTTWMPMPGETYLVNDLICEVNPNAKTYSISFDCHGGHFEESGKLK